ncbi:hypothetical protein ACFLTX_00405 [Chloroflexota bacterium]
MEYNSAIMIRSLLIILLLLGTCQPVPKSSDSYRLQFHPDGNLYIGDQISMEIIPTQGQDNNGKQVRVDFEGTELSVAEFSPSGVGQRDQATFWWVLDSSGLEAGEHELGFSILPGGPSWIESFYLFPEKQAPYPDSAWETANTDCCVLHYISGTDAARDIAGLSTIVDDQAADVAAALDSRFHESINITFIPKLVGHGGFASDGIYVSYLDDNITGNITSQVVHHEMVHILDASLGKGRKPSILVEGLAVYLSNGHYKQEDLLQRAASLFAMDAYIPFNELIMDFYGQQHEIGYLEAGALIEYLVSLYGWNAFRDFYNIIDLDGDHESAMESALVQVFDTDLQDLENDFIAFLKSQEVDDAIRNDLELTVAFFDSLRLYQKKLKPSTHFATAWLPDGSSMKEHGIVADYLRSRIGLDVLIFEYLLRTSSSLIENNEFVEAGRVIGLVNLLLYIIP